MNIQTTPIEGLLIIQPRLFEDDRGYFFESFNHQKFEDAIGSKAKFVQDNESFSHQGVLKLLQTLDQCVL